MWRSTDIPRLWSPKRFGDRGSASGRVEPHAVILRFYESDYLGRSLPSLIAERSRPGQSAPVACGMRRGGVCGSAGQSASASFSSLERPIRLDELPALRSRARKPWFYLRLGTEPA